MDPITLGLLIKAAPALIQGGAGLVNSVVGGIKTGQALNEMESTDYNDYTQQYFNELQMRARQGLPTESMDYAETGVDRAFGAAQTNMEDRRAGLIGLGQSSMGLADAYRQLAAQDAEMRVQNQQQMLGEMSNRATNTYNEDMGMANVRLALARGQRQEGLAGTGAGMQTSVNQAGAAMGLGQDNGALVELFTKLLTQKQTP
jgi:hypothetical protein